jgi:lipopolysaccharide transport system permease protein
MRDAGNLISVLITFLMFLTPVLYEIPNEGILWQISRINPVYYLISAPRELILSGTMSNWIGFMISGILSVVIFIVCLMIFHLSETRVTERI